MGLFDAVSSLFGQGVQNIYNSQQTWKQREANYQMTDYLYEKDLENWNRVNAYNSPEAQMQRFKDAGLNPNLVVGQGTPGQASMPAPAKEASQPGFQGKLEMPRFIAEYQDYRLKQKQMDTAQSVIDKNAAETELKKAELIMKGLENQLKPDQIKFALEQMDQTRKEWPYDLQAKEYNVEKIKKEIEHLGASASLSKAQTAKIAEWLYEWEMNGINIDRDGLIQRKGWKLGQDLYEMGQGVENKIDEWWNGRNN